MTSRTSHLIVTLLAGLAAGVGCGPQQEFNSTETVKTQLPTPTKKAPANVNKPLPTKTGRDIATKPIAD